MIGRGRAELTGARSGAYDQRTFAKEDGRVDRTGKGIAQGGRFFFYYFPGVRPRAPLG